MSSKTFDPNSAAASDSGIFGLPYSFEESKLVYIPVPWEATTSYGGGTSKGPQAILEASRQVDLYDYHVVRPYESGLYWSEESVQIRQWNERAMGLAGGIIERGGNIEGNAELTRDLEEVNQLSSKVNAWVREATLQIFRRGKIPALVGGDHSSPYGAFQACSETIGDFGILHIDAHSDTRNAFEGFKHSHASIMRNTLDDLRPVRRLVQVGIRDFCEEELEYSLSQEGRIITHYDAAIQRWKMEGNPWLKKVEKIVSDLPPKVWISFDIDGLDPRFCPHTGTPVPGGLEFMEAVALFEAVARSRKIVGFDLNEVAPGPEDEWDANVGARMLYKLSAFALASQGLARWNQL